MKAVRVHAFGSPDHLRYEDVPVPEPGSGQALVRIEAAGVNFIDILFRTGQYGTVLPFTIGYEGAGVVEATGPGVSEVHEGERVAYTSILGAYAESALVPATRLVRVPDGVDTRAAAAVIFQGMTAHYLTRDTYPLGSEDTVLVHAAAGGVGTLLVQMAKGRGARVFGTVSTEEKAALAREAGADEVIVYTRQDFCAEVRRLTDAKGVQVVYDSVGRATFDQSLDCLASRGCMVVFGQSSGPIHPVDTHTLVSKGSVYLTRTALMHHIASRQDLLRRANDVLNQVASGQLRLFIARPLKLAEAAEAHRLLESRATLGKLLLIP